jgi:hypothetical protein
MSSLVSVVGDSFVDDWNSRIVHIDDPLSEFHAKFWGIADIAGDQENAGDQEDAGDQGDDNDMDVDGSAAEDDDIIPACYVLDISIRGVEDKIWVRADYIRLFKFAEEFYAENVANPRSPCLVITGQPGTGALSDVVIMLSYY